MSAHASASQAGATSSILRPRAWVGGGFLALLALAVWLGSGAREAAAAAECPNEAIRIAQGATRLPDCRAYERVSPADSTGGVVGVDAQNKPLVGFIRADGDAISFGSSSAVGETERGALKTQSLAHRIPGKGWASFNTWTTSQPDVLSDLSMAEAWPLPSADMSRVMFSASRSLGPPNPVSSGGSIYLTALEGKGAPTWLSRWTSEGTQPNPSSNNSIPLGGSPDFSSGWFRYATPLTSLAGDNLRTASQGLYFFSGEALAPAGVLPSGIVSPLGAVPAGTATAATTGSAGVVPQMARNQVSADGSRLFFVSPASGAEPKQLYVQEGAGPGRLISRDSDGNPAAAGIAELKVGVSAGAWAYSGYAFATPDGSRVLFRSTSALTDDAPAEGLKTYRASIDAGSVEVEYLADANGYPLAINDDASAIVYGVAGSVANTISVSLWDENRPSGLPYVVAEDMELKNGNRPILDSSLSADADALVFASNLELEPGMAPLAEINYTQIYRWTKESETVICISCRRDGGTPARFGSRMTSFGGLPSDNPAFPTGSSPDLFNQSTVRNNRKISGDGSRVFFDTSDPLDPARDVNGVRDVYMWEDGEVHLLTSGRGPAPSLIYDNSVSGDDVMIVTRDGLIPADTNETYDVYDVRVDGGFDETVQAGCEGDACQPQSAAGRDARSPGSIGLLAAGNQRQTRLGPVKVAQQGKPGQSAKVRVNVPAAGNVKLAGNLVKGKSKGVKSKGAVTLQLSLNRAGKRKLAAKGQLSTKVTTTFRDGEGRTRQSSVTLRFKQGANR